MQTPQTTRNRYSVFTILALTALLTGCEIASTTSPGSSADTSPGQAGSMARFALTGDYLYTVDRYRLKTFDVSDAANPQSPNGKEQYMDFGIETIFPLDSLLFLGSQTGMYIYSITRPDFPRMLGYVSHITACDPVVASGNYAYVTLNSESIHCGRSVNELHVYELSDLQNPRLVHTESALKHPKGLGVDQNRLFVCDNGLKVYDVTNPAQPLLMDDISDIPETSGAESYDVIPIDGLLLLISDKGLYQFDYTGRKLSFVSKLPVSPNK
ncbi:MAG: hypothetical protein LBD89_01035 [Tannerellaceae bacterium]|jgi:hypothetical protein|nr:hypothetical protein [Tannerellaceae bacterium]